MTAMPSAPPSRERLLLAEDAEPLGSRLAAMLGDAGYEVARARSVPEALALEGEPPALVLLDSHLAGGDALDYARHCSHEVGVPVVLLGSIDDVERKVRGFDAGAIDFVPQPVEGRELLARVKRHLTVARVRHALQESEAKFRSVTESAIDAIISADANGRIRTWNRAAEAILGWSAEEVAGRPLEVIIPERFRAAHRAGLGRVAAGGEHRVIGRTVELAAIRRDGQEIPIELSLATWMLGEERYFTGILRDLRERREAELRFRAVTESAIDAIVSVDVLGQIVGWNRAAERIFGYSEAEILGKPVETLIPERFRDAHRAGMSRVTDGGPSHVIGSTVELAAVRRDGSELPIELSLSTWSADRQRFYTGIIRDITRRKEAEARLASYAEELAGKHAELQAEHAELERSERALSASLEQVRKLFAVVAEALEGQTVGGRFHLEKRLARGGFGVVYRGRDTERDATVAIKVLSPPPEGSGESHIERFRREARAALEIDHPNAVRYLEQGVTDAGLPYLVMELLDGETLKQRLARERTLALGEGLELAAAVASCLASVHARGIVHRDITPANIFLHRPERNRERVEVKLLDFGLAKPGGPLGGYTVTRRSELLGTPQYLAPERVTGDRVDGGNDVYSLAVVLFEALTGELPYPSTEDPWAAIYSRVYRLPRRIATVDPALPPALDALLARALERVPEARPDAEALERELRAIAAGLGRAEAERRFEPAPGSAAVEGETWVPGADDLPTRPRDGG